MSPRRPLFVAFTLAAGIAVLLPSTGRASGRTQTLRVYDAPVSITLTHADGTVVAHAPYPEPKAGDTLDVDSLDYAGNHVHHAKRWLGSTHLRCVFSAGPPECESHFATGGSMLVFTGSPGTVTNGTGIYHGATGRVISAKDVPGGHGASDVVARVRLAR